MVHALDSYKKKFNNTLSDSRARGFESQFDGVQFGKDIINMNDGYLLSLLKIMEEYNILKVHGMPGVGKDNPDYYYQLWELLWNMRDLLDPKMGDEDKEQVDKDMMTLLNKIDGLFVKGGSGILINKREAMITRIKLGKIYRKYLNVMNDRGMLTHVPEDPGTAMSKFTE